MEELALVREGIEKIHEALIKCIYELIPQNIDINLLKIKHVISKSNKVVDENMGKSFYLLLSMNTKMEILLKKIYML